MKKILFIIPSMKPAGGIERVVATIANKLSSVFKCTILTYDNKNSFYTLNSNVKKDSLNCDFELNMNNRFVRVVQTAVRFLKVSFLLRDKIKSYEYDYIYVTHPLDHLQILIMGCNPNKIVISEHGANDNYNKVYRFIRKYTYKKCYAYCVSTSADYAFYKDMNFPVQYTPHYRPSLPYERVSGDAKVVLCIGRLTPDKQHLKLINMWKKVQDQTHSDWTLRIVGSGELRDILTESIKKNNLEESVELHEAAHNIERYYLDSSIFVLTSRSEGFGLVLLEAISFGLPVISFDCPFGPRDIVTPKNGFLVPVDAENDFVSHLVSLIRDEELRKNYIESSYLSSKAWNDEKITNIWMNILK